MEEEVHTKSILKEITSLILEFFRMRLQERAAHATEEMEKKMRAFIDHLIHKTVRMLLVLSGLACVAIALFVFLVSYLPPSLVFIAGIDSIRESRQSFPTSENR